VNNGFLKDYESRIGYIREQIGTVIGQITKLRPKSVAEFSRIIDLLEQIRSGFAQVSEYLEGPFQEHVPAMETILDTIGEHIVTLSNQEDIQGEDKIMTTLTSIQEAISGKLS
jgi:hypothetical protein